LKALANLSQQRYIVAVASKMPAVLPSEQLVYIDPAP